MTRSSESFRLVSGGYLVARPVERTPYMDASLLPARLWSASNCLARIAPGDWALEWVQRGDEERRSAAEAFGIPVDRLPALIEWATARFDRDFGWPGIFLTLEAAREFCAAFVPEDSDAAILGLALSDEDVEGVLQWLAPGPREGAPGVHRCLEARGAPASGGLRLGWDVLVSDHGAGPSHSYLCNGLERDFAARLGARPNVYGLFDDPARARQCASYAGREDVGAEPGAWRAWLLTAYPRSMER